MAELNITTSQKNDISTKFLNQTSLEITPRQIEKIPLIEEALPPGSTIFIALIDPADTKAQQTAATALRKSGFEPIPHIPARFVINEQDLRDRLKALSEEAGTTQALVLGGGAPIPLGAYDQALQLLKTNAFQDYGFKRIGIAGHPEGNPDITKIHGEAMLLKALQDKQAWIKENGLEGFIATQFLFEAEPVAEWAASLRRAGIDLPIRVGIPGPATIKTLVKYAAMCGVGNSARFLRKQALNITKLLTVNTPDKFIDELALISHERPELGIEGPHHYPFGGFDKLFTWLTPKMNPGA